MKIGAYLQNISQKVVSCVPGDTAQEAAAKLRENRIGAMPVLCEDGKLIGMISERDLIGKFAEHGAGLVDIKVADMLTKSVIFMGPNAELSDAMQAMSDYGFRHVPIVAGGQVVGMVSIRDVLADAINCVEANGQNPALAVAAR